MPDKEKFHEIFEKVKKTFEILREMLPETPLEPAEYSADQSRPGQDNHNNRTVVSHTGLSLNLRGDLKTAAGISNHRSPLFYQARQRYLENIIAAYEYMRLPGFRFGNRPLSIPFDQAFVPFSLFDKRLGSIRPERDDGFYGGAGALSIASALQRYRRLAITGNAGCGKSSLLAALLLAYARPMTGERVDSIPTQTNHISDVSKQFNKQRLHTGEENYLPILISLRELGQYLQQKHRRSDKDGPTRLMNYLRGLRFASNGALLATQENFFEVYLAAGKAIVLMDGLDEVENQDLRQRVVQLIEKFVQRYPACRYIVTSRPLDSQGTPLLGEQFGTLQVRDFSPFETRNFVRSWSISLENGLAGCETPEVLDLANQRADDFIKAMDGNPHTAQFATNPLTLTLLALIQRFRKAWPERRADLYDSVLEILTEKIDKNISANEYYLTQVEEKRTLEMIAFWLHQHNTCEMQNSNLKLILQPWFLQMRNNDKTAADEAMDGFLGSIVTKNNNLFAELRPDTFGFRQRTFQEFLAAQALAEREDTLAVTLQCLPSPWWREVILFEARSLGKQAQFRVSELIRFILDADPRLGLQPRYTTFLAAECLLDLDPKHLEVGLLVDVKNSLKKLASAPIQEDDRLGVMNKVTASNALMSLQSGQPVARYWKLQYGEPEWVRIPAGEFWMGDADASKQPGNLAAHRVSLPEYQISRVAITNIQYAMYLKDIGAQPPDHWQNGQPPKGKEHHPVVNVTWHEALGYCTWLGEKIGQPACLPSEAEWEKAARGNHDQREYPWGTWAELHANTSELALGDTTPVGLFPNGASPFGLLDMTGNVREWTRSLSGYSYPYDPMDKARENLLAADDQPRVLRGGSYYCTRESARCTQRQRYYPDFGFYNFGFRVVIRPTY